MVINSVWPVGILYVEPFIRTTGMYINSAGVILAGSATLYGEVNYCQGSHVEEPIQDLAGIRIGF